VRFVLDFRLVSDILNLRFRYFRQQNQKIAEDLMSRTSTVMAVEETLAVPGGEDVRLRALERLYLRREAVDALIRSLEAYQRAESRKAPCVPISAARKCS
jgi:hypothetical protein